MYNGHAKKKHTITDMEEDKKQELKVRYRKDYIAYNKEKESEELLQSVDSQTKHILGAEIMKHNDDRE